MLKITKKSLFLLALLTGQASASIIINKTRLVYPSDAKNISVQLLNKSRTIHLAQSWIDDGNPQSRPEDMLVPFMVSPPVVKISANGGQTLKISATSATSRLPKDRESVFWLNVLDVPPMPDNNEVNYMQVALRNRIKLFWRPSGLSISPQDINEHISFSRDENRRVCINNTSPYYITLVQIMRWDGKSLKAQKGKAEDNFLKKTLFVPPFSCMAPEETRGSLQSGNYQFVRMDDYGSKIPFVTKF